MYDLAHYGRINDGSVPYDFNTGIARDWRRSTKARGGYWLGSFTLSAEDLTRQELLWWYRHCMADEIIERTAGVTSWQGIVYEMLLTLDGVQYRRTLDREWWHNRVKVTYRDAGVQAATAWSEDTGSSDVYGQMDYIDTLSECTSAEATGLRDTRLADYAYPRSRMIAGLEFGGEKRQAVDSLTITVAGLVFTLNWILRETSIVNTAASTALTTLVGASEFVTAGSIDTNAMAIDADCTTPQRLWDLMEKIILAGDASGNRWAGGVYAGRKFDYRAAATAVEFEKSGDVLKRRHATSDVLPSSMMADFIIFNAEAPVDETPAGGNVLDDPRKAWIEEVEFVAPDKLILKPAGFEDVEVLQEQLK
jgi:hypothetical protein